MKTLYEKLIDPFKTLPGFAWVVIAVTLAWTRMTGTEELSSFGTLILTLVCWVAFRCGAIVDGLYDLIYNPQRTKTFGRKGEQLKDARDLAAGVIFKVADYADAGARAFVYPEKKLYDVAKTLVKNTEHWEKKIGPLNDRSKMARTFFVFCSVCTLLLVLAKLSPEVDGWLRRYHPERLWFLDRICAQVLLALTSFVFFLWLRVKHNIELYTYVHKNVVHVQTDKREVPYLFENILSGVKI